jgi:hypothetical protein
VTPTPSGMTTDEMLIVIESLREYQLKLGMDQHLIGPLILKLVGQLMGDKCNVN